MTEQRTDNDSSGKPHKRSKKSAAANTASDAKSKTITTFLSSAWGTPL